MHGSERRRAHRVSLGSVDARLSGIRGVLIDLSVLGALVQLPCAQGADADITFELEVGDVALQLPARVIRSTAAPGGYRIALEFVEPSMDELVRLSRIIEQYGEPVAPAAAPAPGAVPAASRAAWWA